MKHNCVYMCSIEWASLYFIVARCRRIIHFIRYAGIWQEWRDACEKKKTTKQTVRPLSTLCTQSLLQFLFFLFVFREQQNVAIENFWRNRKYMYPNTHTHNFSVPLLCRMTQTRTHTTRSVIHFLLLFCPMIALWIGVRGMGNHCIVHQLRCIMAGIRMGWLYTDCADIALVTNVRHFNDTQTHLKKVIEKKYTFLQIHYDFIINIITLQYICAVSIWRSIQDIRLKLACARTAIRKMK